MVSDIYIAKKEKIKIKIKIKMSEAPLFTHAHVSKVNMLKDITQTMQRNRNVHANRAPLRWCHNAFK